MKIMIPTKITDSMISDYTLSYTEPSAWSASTSYTAGMRASVGKDVYECITANTNAYPPNNTTNYNWIYVGVSNQYKAFDDKINTQTISTGSISFTLTTGEIVNGIALLNVQSALVTVVMTDPLEGEVYRREINLVRSNNVDNLFDYFFEEFDQVSDVTILDLPPYKKASVTITLSGGSSDTVSLGMVVVGKVKEIGLLNWGCSVGITDYSVKDKDPFGNVTITQRGTSKRANFEIDVPTKDVDAVSKELQRYTTVPIVWVGSEHYESTIVYGFYKDFTPVLSNLIKSKCTVEVEGLI